MALDEVVHDRAVQVRVLVGPPGEPLHRSVGQLVAEHPFAVEFDVHHEPFIERKGERRREDYRCPSSSTRWEINLQVMTARASETLLREERTGGQK